MVISEIRSLYRDEKEFKENFNENQQVFHVLYF